MGMYIKQNGNLVPVGNGVKVVEENPLRYVKQLSYAFNSASFSSNYKLKLDIPNCTSFTNSFSNSNISEIVIHNLTTSDIAQINHMCYNCSQLKQITFTNSNNNTITIKGQGQSIFSYAANLEEINGNINWQCTYPNSSFYNCTKLRKFSFVPNCIGSNNLQTSTFSLAFSNVTATDDFKNSIITLGNALKSDNTGTITLHANVKTALTTIMGDVDTDTGLFVRNDASGTLSLTNYITTNKGWTIA